MAAGLLSVDFAGKPLRGIVHSAGVLDDGVLLQQDWSRFQRVMCSKVDGSWNLHQLSMDYSLDFFVLYSSGASFTGSPGQSNHAAANAFMDGLAHLRRALGLPGLSINWGPWSEIGAAVRTGVVSRADTKGFSTIAPAQGLRILEHLLAESPAQVGVLPLSSSELAANRPRAGRASLYAELEELTTGANGSAALSSDFASSVPQLLPLLFSASPGRRAVIVLEQLQKQAAKTMGLDAGDTIDPGRPLTDLGLDSLMAVELRNEIAKQIGKSLPATLLFNHPTLDELTAYLLDEVLTSDLETGGNTDARKTVVAGSAHIAAAESELDQLSEDEMAELLAEALEEPDDIG
jgi:myxalamid-type polyketide synthase MxaB